VSSGRNRFLKSNITKYTRTWKRYTRNVCVIQIRVEFIRIGIFLHSILY
jgi:hypothetical protein